MYLYYEHHRDAADGIILTEMRLSSNGSGRLYIDHKSPREAMLKSMCLPILKWPPINKRSMDEKCWVWTYFDDWGERVIEKLKEVTKPICEIVCIEVVDLTAQAVNNRINLSSKPRVKPEDFFYNYGKPTAQAAMPKETLEQKLKSLMGETLDKSSYRRAALKYHPDRNNGDGSKMSELNSLWSVYNA